MNQLKFNCGLTDDQKAAWFSREPEIGIGGAVGGGKSRYLCNKAFVDACRYPGLRSFLGRKIAQHFKMTTLQTWYEVIPSEAYDENKQEQSFKIRNGKYESTIFYGGLDSREALSKFTSGEYGRIYIDQAEELEESDFLTLLQRLRQRLPNGKFPDFFQATFSANPKQCAFRERFIISPKSGIQKFIQMLPAGNEFLAPGYLDRLKELYKNRPELYQAYVLGSWDILEGTNVVIKWSWADQCTRIKETRRYHNKCGVSCDSARFGDDETVIYGWMGTRQIDKDVFGKKDEDFVAARCLAMLRKIGGNWVAIGGGANGQAVITQLSKLCDNDVTIIEVNEASKADDPLKFYNKRAEMYWEAGEMMADNAVGLLDDKVNIGQLSAHTYTYSKGRILLDEKDKVKERIGRSPDFADATVIGLWALVRAPELPQLRTLSPTSTQRAIEQRQLESSRSRHGGSYEEIDGKRYYEE